MPSPFCRFKYCEDARAALRASLVERVVGKVEDLTNYGPTTRYIGDGNEIAEMTTLGVSDREWIRKDDVLAVLRAELSEGRTQ